MDQLKDKSHYIEVQEYLDGEKLSDIRHEYVDGQVYAMAGGTKNHNKIAGNVFSDFKSALDGGPCETYMNDVRLRVFSLESESYYYPDVVVSCEPDDGDDQHVEKPTLIVEVLSDSTEKRDKTEKFFAYRSLQSLEEYVIISQKTKEVTIARKGDQWKPETLIGDDFELYLGCLSKPIPSSRIYRNVKF
jgi:Uma2 family endonuclease